MIVPQISAFSPGALAVAPGTHWLTVAAMLTDLAFETDPMGRFTAFGPGKVLGQPAANLLGLELASLLAGGTAEEEALSATQFRSIVTTICLECVAWHGKLRLASADGSTRMYRLALAPRITGAKVAGVYGILFDLEAPELTLPDGHAGHNGPPALRHNTMLDAETGLWSGRTFGDELGRRFDRLDVEGHPGSLIYLGFSRATSGLRPAIALRLAEELRDVVRPTDLLGRIDETTIGLWCDGMDHLTAGERAAKFCTTLPPLLPQHAVISVGVGPRWSNSGDQPDTVMEHAAIALRLADMACQRAGGEAAGAWRVWQAD
ncbi:GGDEF domain-containing protein [Acidocella aromatica]|uniref:GGDEF domain-containing protein n=1 Tax=Acidocella aromatica TaxID=1303579 RepID=A0A840VJM9_9PROT|nr:GGDEF domain-containing protein [Acidocella aromatica]MBB5372459.1 GGDEF domain-containing protein [Acidocella aromatica]